MGPSAAAGDECFRGQLIPLSGKHMAYCSESDRLASVRTLHLRDWQSVSSARSSILEHVAGGGFCFFDPQHL